MNTILVAIVAATSVSGAVKGFGKSLFSVTCMLVSAIVAFFAARLLLQPLVDAGFLFQPIKALTNSVLEGVDENLVCKSFENMLQIEEFLASVDYSSFTKNTLLNILGSIQFTGNQTISGLICNRLHAFIINVLLFFILFIIIYALLKFLQPLFCKIIKLGGLVATDKVVGFIFGVVKGLAIYALFTVFAICLANALFSDWIIQKINQGYVSALIYQNYSSMILKLFGL